MLRLTSSNKGQCTSEDTEYIFLKFFILCTFYRLNMFCDYIQLQYIGTDTYDSQKILADISLAFSKLKMAYTVREKQVACTLDTLFSTFIVFLPLLSPNFMSWSFFLVTSFFMFYPKSCWNPCNSGATFFFDISTLTTSLLQNTLLRHCINTQLLLSKKN